MLLPSAGAELAHRRHRHRRVAGRQARPGRVPRDDEPAARTVVDGIPSFVWHDAVTTGTATVGTMTGLWIVLARRRAARTGVVASYNRFVRQRNLVQESWRQIDVELKRRHDLIPNLVETVKGYATQERTVSRP